MNHFRLTFKHESYWYNQGFYSQLPYIYRLGRNTYTRSRLVKLVEKVLTCETLHLVLVK